MDPFLGEIRAFGFNFAPQGWALCQGQLLPISQYTAVFSLLGTNFGGDGRSTFGLPDLRGRTIIDPGQGPGLSQYDIGETNGTESVTLLVTEMPSHSHAPLAKTQTGTANMHSIPQPGDYMSRYNASATAFGSTWNSPPLENATTLAPTAVSLVGGNQPHENRQPFLTINYCISLGGVYPARN